MNKTKIEKFNEIKDLLVKANADTELVELVKNEIEIIKNKYATAKMKKDLKKNDEYKTLEPLVLSFFNDDYDKIVYNKDIDIDGMSTSKKTTVFKRLIEKGLVEKIAPKGKIKVVGYKLVDQD